MARALALLLVCALLLPTRALAQEATALPADAAPGEGWLPGDGEETAETRQGADFEGMGFLFPVRLHFTRGGFLDGKVAGFNPDTGEFALELPRYRLRIDASLVRATTPLGPIPEPGSALAERLPPPLAAQEMVYRLQPTWRSGVGLALNALAPGTGSFIQKKEPGLGFLFLGLDLFFAGAGLLALFGPSRIGDQERIYLGVVFFSFDVLVRVAGASHAFAVGRERRLVPTTP